MKGGTTRATRSSTGEYGFVPDAEPAPAGAVLFEIEHLGGLSHGFEVAKTDLGPDDLPVEDGKADVEAEDGEEIGEVEDGGPGESVDLAFELEATQPPHRLQPARPP